MTTGAQIAAARRQAGLTGTELSAKVGLSSAALSRLEGDAAPLRRTVAMKLAGALGVSVGELLGWNRSLGGAGLVSLPVLGTIRAGLPRFAGEGATRTPSRPAEGLFYLRAEDGWPDMQIPAGAHILFDSDSEPAAGDLVACAVGPGEPLLCRWQPDGAGAALLLDANGRSQRVCAREFETGWAVLYGVAQGAVHRLK